MAAGKVLDRPASPAWNRALSTSAGTKFLIAATGFLMVGFLVLHLAGNVTFLFGPKAFNEYSHKLTGTPIIYLFEAGLAAIFLIHIVKAVRNYFANRSARGEQGYLRVAGGHLTTKRPGSTSRKTVASSSSIVTGLVILAFVILHLKGLKFGHSGEFLTEEGPIRDLYATQLEYFRNPALVVLYVVSVVLIGFHLWHGIWSAFQSFGLANRRYLPVLVFLGKALTAVLTVGFCVFPIYTYLLAHGHIPSPTP